MNIPICAVAAVITVLFLNFDAPRTSFREKMASMDWGYVIYCRLVAFNSD